MKADELGRKFPFMQKNTTETLFIFLPPVMATVTAFNEDMDLMNNIYPQFSLVYGQRSTHLHVYICILASMT